jgi:hypothetical protein
MWTENVTWFSNEEGKKGRIQVGQLADLIMPDRDYFSCPEDEIADTTSDLTIVGGKVVYAAGDLATYDEVAPPPAMPDWSPVHFLPLALLPLQAIHGSAGIVAGFRRQALFRLSWYGRP